MYPNRFVGTLIFVVLSIIESTQASDVTYPAWTPWVSSSVELHNDLSNAAITTIRQLDPGEVWIASTEGIFRTDGWSTDNIRVDWLIDPEYPVHRVVDFFKSSGGKVYVFTQYDGIFALNEDTGAFQPLPTQSLWDAGNTVSGFLSYKERKVALAIINDRVFSFYPESEEVFELALESGAKPLAVVDTHDGFVGVITSDQMLTRFLWQDGRLLNHTRSQCRLDIGAVKSVTHASDNKFYFVETDGRVSLADVSENGCYRVPLNEPLRSHLAGGKVSSLRTLKRSGGVVFATDRGVLVEQDTIVYSISSSRGRLASDEILAVEEVGQNKILIGSFLGLSQATKEGAIIVTNIGTEPTPSVVSIDSSPGQGTFLATYKNLYRMHFSIEGIRFSKFELPNNATGISVIAVSSKGLWVGLQDGRVLFFDSSIAEDYCEFSPDSSIAPSAVTDIEIAQPQSDSAIVTTLNGSMFLIKECSAISIQKLSIRRRENARFIGLDALSQDSWLIYSIGGTGILKSPFARSSTYDDHVMVEPHHTYASSWDLALTRKFAFLAHPDGTLKRVDQPSMETDEVVVEREWQLSSPIYSVEVDALSRAWITTHAGLSLLDKMNNLALVIPTTVELPISLDYGASHSGHDGTLYFGGTGGVIVIVDARFYPRRELPRFVLSEVSIGSRSFKIRDTRLISSIEVPSNAGSLAFEFNLSHFQFLKNASLKYKLDGFDTKWKSSGNSNSVNYSKLPPGDYIFRAKGANATGTWSDNEIAIPVRVLRPVWQSWWAVIAYLLLALALYAWARRWHERRVEERVRLQIAEEAQASFERLEDDYQGLQETAEHMLRSREALAEELLEAASFAAHPQPGAPVQAVEDWSRLVSSRLQTLHIVHALATRTLVGDSVDMNAVVEELHKQLIGEQPGTASAILVNDVEREPIPLKHGAYLGLVLYEALVLALCKRPYGDDQEPIVEVKMEIAGVQEDDSCRYNLILHDSGLPDTDKSSTQQRLPLAHHLAQITGGEISQIYERGNRLEISLSFDSDAQA